MTVFHRWISKIRVQSSSSRVQSSSSNFELRVRVQNLEQTIFCKLASDSNLNLDAENFLNINESFISIGFLIFSLILTLDKNIA